jgi:hypothetical protein
VLNQNEAMPLCSVGDFVCGTAVLTYVVRAPRVALSGGVADSHMNSYA